MLLVGALHRLYMLISMNKYYFAPKYYSFMVICISLHTLTSYVMLQLMRVTSARHCLGVRLLLFVWLQLTMAYLGEKYKIALTDNNYTCAITLAYKKYKT